jgi:hypothetical protein
MSIPAEFAARIAAFPAVLRELIDAELAAGNTIVEVASCFPAPPAGAYAKLGKRITTRPRATTDTLDFYERDTSIHSGEWTDAKRFYFVIEPPNPPPAEIDTDALREGRNAASAAVSAPAQRAQRKSGGANQTRAETSDAPGRSGDAAPDSVVHRFEASMNIDYEKWHDGIGYDLTLLQQATPAELEAIERILVPRARSDWRDVEALAALDTPAARRALTAAMKNGNAEIRAAVMCHAPELVSREERVAALVVALNTAEFYGGLSQALDDVGEFHPPEIVTALFRGVLERKGDIAIHFAAMLMFIHGKANSPFDWNHRPFFLRFGTTSREERKALFRELCAKVGVDPVNYLSPN